MFKVRNDANSERAEIFLYEQIGEKTDYWTGEKTGISAERFSSELDKLKPKPVDLHIDSGGGDVFQAFAMCSAIQRYPGEVVAHVDGLAASAASYIAVVCSEVYMNDYAYIMIHCASSYTYGNAREIRDVATRLDQIDSNLANIYTKRSKMTHEEVLDYMNAETWFTAEQAHDVGLCTGVIETEERMAASLDGAFASSYAHVPSDVVVEATADARHEGVTTARNDSQDESNARANLRPEPTYLVIDGRIYRKD